MGSRLFSWAFNAARVDVYELDDLDAALAGFEQLTRPAPQLENTASRVVARYLAHFAPREWDASGRTGRRLLADDRRRVVNTGVRSGRAAEIANMRMIAEVGCADISTTPIATRGERLVLARDSFIAGDSPEPVPRETVDVIEINADERITAIISFDEDDIDAAFAELDSRYLAGEADRPRTSCSPSWTRCAALNRRELPPTTPDRMEFDHHQLVTVRVGEDYWRHPGAVEQASDERLHRGGSSAEHLGAVSPMYRGTDSQDGFDAEWRQIDLFTCEGDLISRIEVFDEADLDSALARFDELSGRTAAGKCGKPGVRALLDVLRGPRLGRR